MMSSQSSDLATHDELQLDPVAQGFFGRAVDGDRADGTGAPELSRGDRRAMRVTLAMLGVFAIALIAFVIYARVIMPVPAELGDEPGPTLPAEPAEPN